MLWFDGSIPEAINAAKQRGCVFVVVITGEDEQSAQLMSSWEDDKVSEAAQGCCVAIRVNAKSETCVQFSQFYPVVCIPSSFFIGVNGIPLEVIAGSVSADELMKRIRRVKQMHVEGGSASSEESVYADSKTQGNKATEPAAAFPVRSAATEPAAAPETGRASLYSRGNDDSTLAPVTLAENASSSYSTQGDGNPEVKMERLTKKQEERLEQKKTGEEESEIKKEMERRKLGKDMHDFKRKQEDEQTKRLLEERNREKAEEKAARERVMQQITMDRAERAVRYAKTQEEEKSARLAQLQARQVEQDVKRETLLRERNTKARIQFRLPDGSSFTNQFPSQSRLQEAHTFAAQEVGNRYSNFSLATMFPRREFTDEDMNKTLLELELAPSASLVLLPQSSRSANAVVQSSETGIWAVLGTILYPLLAVWKFLSSFLFATPPPQGPAPSGPAQQSSSYNNSGKRETLSKHTVEKQPKDFKKDGKICRFRNQEDSEEDNNTWNGNSTQQM